VEASGWCDRALALPSEGIAPVTLMRAFEAAGGVQYWRGDFSRASEAYQRAFELATAHGDAAAQANAAYNLAFAYALPGTAIPRALELLRQAREKWESIGDRIGAGRAAWATGSFLQIGPRQAIPRSRLQESLSAARDSLALMRGSGNRFDLAWSLHLVGIVETKLGDVASARPHFKEALDLFAEDKDISGLALVMSDYAELAGVEGRLERRATLTGAADALARRAGTGLITNFVQTEGRWSPERVPAELRPSLERGLAMDEAAAIAYIAEEA
jgi:tetratricopeptide (TPR) repeat protein